MKVAPGALIGIAAVTASLVVFSSHAGQPEVALASGFFALVCTTDTLRSRIPNALTLALFLAGLGLNGWLSGAHGLVSALAGAGAGLSLLLLPYLMGGMGGGDVKAFGALGALLGPWGVFQVFLYTGLFGGLFALLHYAFERGLCERLRACAGAVRAFAATADPACLMPATSRTLRFPYAAAIAFGYYAHVHWGGPL